MSEQGSGGYVPTRPAWSTTRDRSTPAEATADRAPTRVDTSPPVPAVVQIPDAAPPVVLARPRFAQLSYTAFAVTGSVRGAGSGGWQVKQESGEPDAREREVMSREVVTGLRLVTPPPRFPSRDEIESLPRRLTFRRTPVGDVWCHAVPAGNDVTGRPNNVFSHVLLDRSSVRPNDGPDTAGAAGSAASPAATSDERAIQLWRGERWLTPYGADEVQEAVLGEEPRPGEWFSLRALAEFLFDLEAGRFSVMGLLLDAVAAALAGGPPVVLAAPTPDEGAWWIALVQRLTSPTVAGRVSFSTFDRLDAVSTGGTDRLLTVVPDTDVETTSLGARPLVLIDHRDDPQSTVLDDGREVWPTNRGGEVATTDWSRLAMDVCLQGEERWQACLADLDEICRQVEPPADSPAWPLAAAVTRDAAFADTRDAAVADTRRLAARVLLRDHRDDAGQPDRIRVPIEAAISELRTGTTAEIWEAVGDLRPVGGRVSELGESLVASYVEHALGDEEWLTRPDGVRLPAIVVTRTEPVERLWQIMNQTNHQLWVQSCSGPGEVALVYLRRLDVLLRLENVLGEQVVPEALAKPSATAVDCLLGSGGRALVAGMAQRDRRLIELIWSRVTNVVKASQALPGERMPSWLAEWMGRDYTTEDLVEMADGERLASEILIRRCLDEEEADENLSIAAAVEMLRRREHWAIGRPSSEVVQHVLYETRRGRPWSIPALTRLVEQSKSDSVDVGMARELSRAVQGAGFTRETSRLAGLLRQAGAAARGSGEPPLSPHETAMLAVHHRLAPEWYLDGIDGVSLGAGELLRALAEVWPTLDEAAQGVLAPHAVVAGVQAGMGQIGLLPSHEAVDLVRAATREPVRHLLREAVGPGIQPARGMIIQLLGRPVSAINRDRLGERVADCFTRSVLLEAGNGQGFHHNYLMLPLPVSVQTETGQEDLARVVLGDWLAGLSRREAQDYLAEQIRVVEPHLRGDGQTDWLVRWCEPALPSEEGKRSLRMFRR